MKLFRIADTRHTIWSGAGAMLVGGRFNSPGRPVIYAASTFAGAMLEVLVHARIGKVPRTHGWVEATVPDDVGVEHHTAETLPREWDTAALQVARQFGDAWLTESRTALLIIPSVVVRAEFNVLVNPAHPDAARIVVTDPQPVVWDERLFIMPSAGQS
ncbi:RES family NAD+ phosphorylase [Burkholderia arboris]|uniref:RES family NAD+ phosphorylase n=1 Tax=Burkholderia arboris TaxID=488730 RepID=UPI001CA420AD|nr:RES domain-containing protein [Burkholderia arboris]MBY8605978.1 RES domain-containing protein [Burkholderia arboris]MCA8050277.1 RES domain-containing protein [Burkholderia arboris]